MSECKRLYTPENIVFKSVLNNLTQAKLDTPVTVLRDITGNHALVHGNHRAYHFYADGRLNELRREVIGTIAKDVSKDPYYRLIRDLKVIDK